MVRVASHRRHDALHGGGRQLLPLGLLHHGDPQVLQLEHHALQQGLPRVRPVLWKLCGEERRGEERRGEEREWVKVTLMP